MLVLICWVVAGVLFLCAAINVKSDPIQLGWLGAFFAAIGVVLHLAHVTV